MSIQLLETYQKSQAFFHTLEKFGDFTHNQKSRNALQKYIKGYYTLEEAIKEALDEE